MKNPVNTATSVTPRFNWGRHFDAIYLIHCLDYTVRYGHAMNEMLRLGIADSGVFHEVDTAGAGSMDKIVADSLSQPGLNLNVNTVNLCRTMINILSIALHSGFERILVIEDDAAFLRNKSDVFKAISSIPDDADIVNFDWVASGPDQEELSKNISGMRLQTGKYEGLFFKPSKSIHDVLHCTTVQYLSSKAMSALFRRWTCGSYLPGRDWAVQDEEWVSSEGLSVYYSKTPVAIQMLDPSGSTTSPNQLSQSYEWRGLCGQDVSSYSLDSVDTHAKPGIPWTRLFDAVYLLHEESAKERFANIMSEMNRVGLSDSGILRVEWTFKSRYDKLLGSGSSANGREANEAYSFLRILSEAERMGFGRILFIEDDAAFLNDTNKISEIVGSTPDDDIVLYDWQSHIAANDSERLRRLEELKRSSKYGENFFPVDTSLCNMWRTTAVALTGKAVSAMRRKLDDSLVAVDWFQNSDEFKKSNGLSCCAATTPICTQRVYADQSDGKNLKDHGMYVYSRTCGIHPEDYNTGVDWESNETFSQESWCSIPFYVVNNGFPSAECISRLAELYCPVEYDISDVKTFGHAKNDGNYSVPTSVLRESSRLLSFGVGGNSTFEQDVADTFDNISTDLYDHTVTCLPHPVKRGRLHREKIDFGGNAKGIISSVSEPFILKVDIEGYEYGMERLGKGALKLCRMVVMEVHAMQAYHDKALSMLSYLRDEGFRPILCVHTPYHTDMLGVFPSQIELVMVKTDSDRFSTNASSYLMFSEPGVPRFAKMVHDGTALDFARKRIRRLCERESLYRSLMRASSTMRQALIDLTLLYHYEFTDHLYAAMACLEGIKKFPGDSLFTSNLSSIVGSHDLPVLKSEYLNGTFNTPLCQSCESNSEQKPSKETELPVKPVDTVLDVMPIDWKKYVDAVYLIHFTGDSHKERLPNIMSELRRVGIRDNDVIIRYTANSKWHEAAAEKCRSDNPGWGLPGWWADVGMATFDILVEAIAKGLDSIAVFETDCVFIKDTALLKRYLDTIPENAGIAKLEWFEVGGSVAQVAPQAAGESAAYWSNSKTRTSGAACYIIRRKGMEELLRVLRDFCPGPSDFAMNFCNTDIYVSNGHAAIQRAYPSSKTGGCDAYNKMDLSKYNLPKGYIHSLGECVVYDHVGQEDRQTHVVLPEFPVTLDNIPDAVKSLSSLMSKNPDYREPPCLLARLMHESSSSPNPTVIRLLIENGLKVKNKKPNMPVDDWCWNGGPERLLETLYEPVGEPGSDQYIVL